MTTFKDINKIWLGKTPDNWNIVRLKFHLSKTKGKKPGKIFLESKDTTTPYITASSFENYKYSNFVSSEENIPIVKKEDVLILWDGARAGFIDYGHYGFISSTMVSLSVNKNFEKKYFYYYLKSNQKLFQDFAHGTTIPHADGSLLSNVRIPLIPLQTQTNIANFLDNKTEQISTFIKNKKEIIKLLEEQKQAIIHKAVTKGIEEGVEMKDSGVEWIGEIPKNWKTRRLKFLSNIKTGDKNTEDNTEKGIYPFFVRSPNIEKLNSYSFDEEAILTAGDGVGTGKVFHYYNGKFACHQRVYALTKFKLVTGKYLFNYIKINFYNEVLKYSAKSTVDSLRLPMLQNFIVTLPPIDRQKGIVEYIDKETNLINTAISKIESEIKLIEEYKDSLIYNAVTGKINI